MSKLAASQQKASQSQSALLAARPIAKTQNCDLGANDTNVPELPLDGYGMNRSVVCAGRTGRTGKSPRGRRSVNSSQERPPSADTNSSFPSKKTETTCRSRGESEFFEGRTQQGFECPSCSLMNPQSCQTCRSTRSLAPDHNLIKFLNYLIEFKLGGRPSYSPPPLSVREKGQGVRATQPGRLGQSSRVSLKQRKSECANIHYGYFCDCCKNGEAIRGARYHCLVCEDYDLCGQCYGERGHRHLMGEIAVSASYRHSVNWWELQSQRQQVAGLQGVKALHGRIARLEQKISSSSIR